MDTILYFGVYICFKKNKVFGSRGELFIYSSRAKEGLVLLVPVTEDLYLPRRSRTRTHCVARGATMQTLSWVGCW